MTKYEEIIHDIKNKIATHEYINNQMLLSESEMCRQYNVSRITVRKAVDIMVNEGLLYRIKGKGCFVRGAADAKLSHIYSFTEAVANQGKTPTKKQLSIEMISAEKKNPSGETYADLFHIAKGDKVYVLKSLYFADGRPYCFNTSVLPEPLFPKLEFFSFDNRSLYEVLKSFYSLEITRETQQFSAVNGTPEIYTALGISATKPLLETTASVFCNIKGKEQMFEYYISYVMTDMMAYRVEKFN